MRDALGDGHVGRLTGEAGRMELAAEPTGCPCCMLFAPAYGVRLFGWGCCGGGGASGSRGGTEFSTGMMRSATGKVLLHQLTRAWQFCGDLEDVVADDPRQSSLPQDYVERRLESQFST